MKLNDHLAKLRTHYTRLQKERVQLQGISSTAQRLSKQAIFSIQRKDVKRAHELLQEAEGLLRSGAKIIAKETRLLNEGSWRASLEEFTEAFLFYRASNEQELFPLPSLPLEPDTIFGGLSDMVGELVRLAMQAAADGDRERVEKLHVIAEKVVVFLLSLDATGAVRQKVDQARGHFYRLEDVRYDLSRRV